MKNALIGILILVIGIALTTLIVKSKPEAKRNSSITINVPKVELLTALPDTHTGTIHTQGTVGPLTQITLASEVQGKIIKTSPKLQDGAFFNQGDMLLEVDRTEYKVEVARAELAVSQAQEQLASERAQAAQAKREWRDLGQADANALFLRKPQLNRAKAQLALAQAELNKAKLKLTRTTIRAPFAGRIERYNVSAGQHVGIGSPIATIYATNKVKVRLPLTDKQLALVNLPNTASPISKITITATVAGEKQQWPATLTQVDASIDTQSRQTYVIAQVALPFSRSKHAQPLVPGMFVHAEITSKALQNTLLIPSNAVQVEQAIFTVDSDNKLHKVPITVLLSENGNSIIKAPNNESLNVMVTNLPFATDGLTVEVVDHVSADSQVSKNDQADIKNQSDTTGSAR